MKKQIIQLIISIIRLIWSIAMLIFIVMLFKDIITGLL
nr:MAG TPA: hypothetical protein [Caudoviricetes sp.]DAJ80014.1 MAG TPA: hypothetical protein [Caudoviricetes sp.]DAZ36543.1 MAG TPA: hypothetical protein [Caudoviricetes sp.]